MKDKNVGLASRELVMDGEAAQQWSDGVME
jgi:hypothetical protein